jgi:hypothetical protein
MKRSIVVLAVASLAGCAANARQTDITGQPFAYRSGSGVVESVAPAPKPFMAAAGGSAPDALYRLKIRMDNGRTQYLDTDSSELGAGDRVRLTDERLIEKR